MATTRPHNTQQRIQLAQTITLPPHMGCRMTRSERVPVKSKRVSLQTINCVIKMLMIPSSHEKTGKSYFSSRKVVPSCNGNQGKHCCTLFTFYVLHEHLNGYFERAKQPNMEKFQSQKMSIISHVCVRVCACGLSLFLIVSISAIHQVNFIVRNFILELF